MSHKLIDHSPDLKRLRDEGFEVKIQGNFLLVSGIPYFNVGREIKRGTLVTDLTISGSRTGAPSNHVISFIGDPPCNKDGSRITSLIHSDQPKLLTSGLRVDMSFSHKPGRNYYDYHEKIVTYINVISAPVRSVDYSITAQTFRLIPSLEEDSVFHYPDTNSSRAAITSISEKLQGQKIGIIGLGGTGSYLLDFVAKTPVSSIHIFDDDNFQVHNAFRFPGAPEIQQLEQMPKKVNYLKSIYSRMHKNIIAHDYKIEKENFIILKDLNFIFLSIDQGKVKKELIEFFGTHKISFVDVGLGIEVTDNNSLFGMIRQTTAIDGNIDHIFKRDRISLADPQGEDEYKSNIQIAELNALNATLAIIKWKKICGFYYHLDDEQHSIYSIDDNSIIND